MGLGGLLTRSGLLAAFFVLVVSAPNSALRAEQATNSPASKFGTASADAGPLDPNLLAWPQTAPGYDLGKFSPDWFRKDAPELKFDEIDLGKYLLRLDTSRNVVDLSSHGLTDAPQTSELLAKPRGKKRSRGQNDYYGFTLITPMH